MKLDPSTVRLMQLEGRVIAALKRAAEMLSIAGPLVGEFAEGEIRHYDEADCDGTCIEEDCRDAAFTARDLVECITGEPSEYERQELLDAAPSLDDGDYFEEIGYDH